VTIAYPYGDFDDRVVAASGDAGYLAAACLASGASRGRSASLRRPRVAMAAPEPPGSSAHPA